tara:strand:- start:308 stop:1018 length:711 start_codon:yes stop_codon:yes gene_type:complete
MKKPIIGITLDSEENQNYSNFPWYAIRENYLDSIHKFGGIPFPLFHKNKYIKEIFKILDGLIITGGNFDINPNLYGKKILGTRNTKNNRTKFEIAIFNKFLKSKKPILGICGGEQLINVACGGNLIQDIKKKKNNNINHEQKNPRNETSHAIKVKKNTKLFNIFKKNKILVNSAHHQAVSKIGKKLIVSAKSEDNIIEAIEHTEHPWCIGVQWHPEFLITNSDKLLFKNFINFVQN